MSNPDDGREVVEIGARALYERFRVEEEERGPGFLSYEDHQRLFKKSHVLAYQDAARAILDAIEESGWRIVPVEPTPAMLEAGGSSIIRPDVFMGGVPPGAKRRARDVWADMLRAAFPKVTP